MIRAALLENAKALIAACRERNIKLATAESCTGGLVAAVLTACEGSSDVVECGFVTYSNAAKTELLGVPTALIRETGAVSEAVAQRMAQGALAHSLADIAVSVTGIAGPGGGSAAKPVGLVCIGLAQRAGPTSSEHYVFIGDRTAIRLAAVEMAFAAIRAALAQ